MLESAWSPADRALFRAASRGDGDGVRAALELGASVHARHPKSGRSALLRAALTPSGTALDALLDAGVEPWSDPSALCRVVERASPEQRARVLDMAPSEGVPPSAMRSMGSVLSSCVRKGCVSWLLRFPFPPLPDAQRSLVWSSLIRWATSRDRVPVLDALWTRLPVSRPDSELLNQVFTSGVAPSALFARIQIKDALAETLTDYATSNPVMRLECAIRNGNARLAGQLLGKMAEKPGWGANIDCDAVVARLLFAAARAGSLPLFRQVLAITYWPTGRWTGLVDTTGDTLLHVVIGSVGNAKARGSLARFLLSNGADPNRPNAEGNTAMHLVTSLAKFMPHVLEDLDGAGGDWSAVDAAKCTPLDLLAQSHDLHALWSSRLTQRSLGRSLPSSPSQPPLPPTSFRPRL